MQNTTETQNGKTLLQTAQLNALKHLIQIEIYTHEADENYFESPTCACQEQEIMLRLKEQFGYDFENDEKASEYFLKATIIEIWQYYLDVILPKL